MISKSMLDKVNYQINREIYSAYLYLSMKSYAESIGLKGVANWFGVQVQEELAHAQKFYDYLNQQGERVILEAIEAPIKEFSSALNLFEITLEHEKKVTGLIHDLVKAARKENDYATESFLGWFVTEQVEEEANANDMLDRLKLIGKDGNGLLMFDAELAKRVFNPTEYTSA